MRKCIQNTRRKNKESNLRHNLNHNKSQCHNNSRNLKKEILKKKDLTQAQKRNRKIPAKGKLRKSVKINQIHNNTKTRKSRNQP